MSSENSRLEAVEQKSTWKNIEPLLKWAAVAYGMGFVTVLVSTAQLGISALQVFDAENVWIGFPVAVVIYFADKFRDRFRAAIAHFKENLKRATEIKEHLDRINDPSEMQAALLDITAESYSNYLEAFGLPGTTRFWKKGFLYVAKGRDIFNLTSIEKTKKIVARHASLTRKATALMRFYNSILRTVAIPAVCIWYVWFGYPMIPQRWGGGKPVTVQLSVEADKIPMDQTDFRQLFPTKDARDTKGQDKTGSTEKAKSTTTNPVELYYQTERAYYVKLGNGPVVMLNREAVSALVFVASRK